MNNREKSKVKKQVALTKDALTNAANHIGNAVEVCAVADVKRDPYLAVMHDRTCDDHSFSDLTRDLSAILDALCDLETWAFEFEIDREDSDDE